MAQDSIQEKRERVAQLREQIRERKASESAALSKAENEAREARLDREIATLQAELEAMDRREALAQGDKPEPVKSLADMTMEELRAQPEYDQIEGRSTMNHDTLVAAIKSVRNNTGTQPAGANRTNPVAATENKEGE